MNRLLMKIPSGLSQRCKLPSSASVRRFQGFGFKFGTPKAIKEIIDSDGLSRFPGISSPNAMLRGLDWLGTVAFAMSGTITAGFAGMDILGCAMVGTITAVGGGTVRDLLLGSLPVFWMLEYEYILLCLFTSGATFFAWQKKDKGMFKEDGSLMFWTDAIGVGAFCVIGAQNGIRKGLHPLICILCGMFTATFGGVIRDVLCRKNPRILYSQSEIYATTALTGATTYIALRAAGAFPGVKIAGGLVTPIVLRYFATKYDIKLPVAKWYVDQDEASTKKK